MKIFIFCTLYISLLLSSILGVYLYASSTKIEPIPETINDHDPLLVCQVKIRVERVIDGDTIVANVDFPWGITLRDQTIRAADFDAWETSKRRRTVEVTNEEIEKGKKAKEELEELIDSSKAFYVVPQGRDVYGRLLAKWLVIQNNQILNVSKWAKKNKHVRQ